MTLSVSHLRLYLVPEQELRLPVHNKGSSLRGGFGNAFRRLVCVDMRWQCAACALRYQCPYTRVFNPFLPADAPRLTGNQNIPRPFVFRPPLCETSRYGEGEPVVFELVLIGRAIDYLPYFIVAFRELGVMGFGVNRARVRLDRVESLGNGAPVPVYEAAHNRVRPAAPLNLDPCAAADAGIAGAAEDGVEPLTLEFLTPTTLKTGSTADRAGSIVRGPEFHHIFKRLRDRINALATFYGDGPLALDFKQLGTAAEQVETVSDQTHWVARSRFARRREVEHDLSGFAGSITFRGRLRPFLPLLRIGQYLHVGKNAVFGNGWYVMR